MLCTSERFRQPMMQNRIPGLYEIRSLCEKGEIIQAVNIIKHLQKCGEHIPANVLMTILQGCIRKRDVKSGVEVSSLIQRCGLETNSFFGTHLIRLFTLCGNLIDAQRIFSQLHEQSEFSWGAIISAHAALGKEKEALYLFGRMKMSGLRCDGHIFVAVLKACSQMSLLEAGEVVHMQVVEDGYDSNVFVANSLISMYAKCRAIQAACKMFKGLSVNHDMVSWSALLSGYAQNGYHEEALQLFILMQKDGIQPDKVILVSVLNACADSNSLYYGRLIHNLIIDKNLLCDAFVHSCVIDMYASLGSVEEARKVFDKVSNPCLITWNAMTSGYAKHKQSCYEALKLLSQMKLQGLGMDIVAYLSLIKGGSYAGDLHKGKRIHLQIVEDGYSTDTVIENALIDLYTRCGHLEGACKVFGNMKEQTLATWNAMIGAYSQLGHGQEALHHYHHMQQQGIDPDKITLIHLLKACSAMFALKQGRLIHAHVMEEACEAEASIGNTVIDLYAKCGCMQDAYRCFDEMGESKDVVSWSAMMEGYAECGEYSKAVECFKGMQEQGIEANEVTFLALLIACSHVGYVNEAHRFFRVMASGSCNVEPRVEHYGCMVDLLAHVGRFDEARKLVESMPSVFDPAGCIALIDHYSSEQALARCE